MHCKKNNEGGFVLIVVLTVIGVITAVLMASMEQTKTDVSLAGTWTKHVRAAEVADTGLNMVARQVLDEFNANDSINTLLNTVQFGTTSGGQYAVMILDNDNVGGEDQDGDGNSSTDSDNVFHLVSTGAMGLTEQVYEAYLRINSTSTTVTPPASDGIGALGLCGNNIGITRASNISGVDYAAPPYPCSGGGCDTSPSGGASAPGVSYNSGTVVTMSGGTPGGSPGVNSSAAIDCTEWESFFASAAAGATSTYSASSGPFNASAVASNFGSPSSPKIIRVQGTSGETAQFNGNLNGAGILLIENAHAVFNGTFAFSGLIIIKDNGGGISLSGTSKLYGSVMVISATAADSQTEISIGSNPTKIRYSTQGLGYAELALSGLSGGGGSASVEILALRTTENTD